MPAPSVILLISSHLETGPLLQPPRPAHHRRQAGGREADRLGHAALQHRLDGRHLDRALARFRGRDPARDREPPPRDRPVRPGVRPPLGQLGGVPPPGAPLGSPATFEAFEAALRERYAAATPSSSPSKESGVEAAVLRGIAEDVANCGGRLAAHNWRSAGAGNLGGWQVARCLWFLNVLTGSIGVEGGTSANAWDKWVPRPAPPAARTSSGGTS